MSDNIIFIGVLSLGGLGLFFGVLLTAISKKFHVEIDPKIKEIEDVLPGANCGGCGYPGCAGYAEAVVNEGVAPTLCAPGGESTAKKIAEILGITVKAKEKYIARLLCHGGSNRAKERYIYEGITDCRAVKLLNSHKECAFGCFGFGNCAAVCPFDAITMSDEDLPEIDPEKCTACGACVTECPQNLLILFPEAKAVYVRCSNHEAGKFAMKACEVPCIACGMCVRNCPIDGAIEIKDNLAVQNTELCINCGLCATVCPKNAIFDRRPESRGVTFITDKCIGCTKCARACPVDAITGKVKEKHVVDEEKCVGCLQCYDACPVDAITITTEIKKIPDYYKDNKFKIKTEDN